MKYTHDTRDIPGTYFPVPKSIFNMGLVSGEILVYIYLMYCEDRKTFQCYPSYNTIGTAAGMSKNTVKKYVEGLERRGLIYTEPTMVRTKDGRNHNGSLLYTLQPLKPIEDAYFDKLIRIQNSKMLAQAALEKYDNKLKKKGKLN